MITVYEMAGRSRTVAAIVAVLKHAGVSSSMAREASAEDWRLTALLAQVKKPKALTIAAIIERLEEMERCRCAAYGLPDCALDLIEPDCRCEMHGDSADTRGCELHGDNSRYRMAIEAHEPAPVKAAATAAPQECPF